MNATDLFLQNNLRKFGLNPSDWRLKKVKRKTYKIANVHDGEFVFVGKVDTTKKTPVWNTLI